MYAVLADAAGEVSHDTLLTVIVGLFGIAVSSPMVVMLIQSRRSRQDRAADRFDREHVAARLEESNRRVAVKAADIADRTERSLGLIHALVNSNLTKAMEAERAAVEQALGAITEAIDMKLAAGVDVLPESYAAQAQLDEQLAALNKAIHERHQAMQFINGRVAPPPHQDQLE